MLRKFLVVFVMLVLLCTVPLSVSAGGIGSEDVNSFDDFISFAIEHPDGYMSRLVVLYFLFLLYSSQGERMSILKEVYII